MQIFVRSWHEFSKEVEMSFCKKLVLALASGNNLYNLNLPLSNCHFMALKNTVIPVEKCNLV